MAPANLGVVVRSKLLVGRLATAVQAVIYAAAVNGRGGLGTNDFPGGVLLMDFVIALIVLVAPLYIVESHNAVCVSNALRI